MSSRTLRRIAGATALVVASCLVLAATGFAEDAGAYAQTKRSRVAKQAAARLWESAERARKDGLFVGASKEALRVLHLDADHFQARRFLGYVKREGAWQLVAESAPPEADQGPPGAMHGQLSLLQRKWRTEVSAQAHADVAGMYAALGNDLASRKLDEEARAAYRTALDWNAADPAARKGLGDVRFGALWLTAQQDAARRDALEVRQVEDPGELEPALGVTLEKARTRHFRVESPLSKSAVAGFLATCESAYATYLADLGRDPTEKVFARPVLVCVMDADDVWRRWCDARAHNPESARAHSSCIHRQRMEIGVRGADDDERRRWIAHDVAHLMNQQVFGLPDGSWLDESLATRCTVLTMGSTDVFCTPLREGDSASPVGVGQSWADEPTWRAQLVEAVERHRDVPLHKIVSKPCYEQPLAAMVKAWSFVDFFVATDRETFARMLPRVKQFPSSSGPLLVQTYAKTLEELDTAWRAWVLQRY